MRLGELMQQRVRTIDSRESASAAWSRMRKNRIRHLVVTSDGELTGVISERDLGGRHGEETRKNRSVGELMSPRVVSGTPGMTLRQAADLMRDRIIGSLPVLDGGTLVGIVTATDVLDALGRSSARPTRPRKLRTLPMAESRSQVGRVQMVGAPQIPVRVRASEGDLGMGDRAYIRQSLGERLGRFATAIERVSVRTEDVNGPRGGTDRMCRIKVVLEGLPTVVLERRDASLSAAVDEALAAAETAVDRALRGRHASPVEGAT
ncbi:MAG TPA: CBS domain-containing protein [Steroidobacteraceae bacterium]|nr:CBS domain-containing protein [Steroidobacteraceae bacterium]